MAYHVPVLLNESVKGLRIKPNGIYVDLTFGGGGHSKEILKNLKKGKLLGFDQDQDAMKNAIDDPRFVFVNSNFRFLKNFLRYHNIEKVDGILADLGVSSHHFDKAERGFSFRHDAKLDMRMNTNAKLSAKEIVNGYSSEDLANILYRFGELKNSRKIARKILEARQNKEIDLISDLLTTLQPLLPKNQENKMLAKIFQALRIAVNREIEFLENMLLQTKDVLNVGGRLVIITYHSLEDRLVKNFMRSGNLEGKVEKDLYGNADVPFSLVNRKVITPSDEEIALNNRARSAKLRIVERNEV